jgi:hypothetical protein
MHGVVVQTCTWYLPMGSLRVSGEADAQSVYCYEKMEATNRPVEHCVEGGNLVDTNVWDVQQLGCGLHGGNWQPAWELKHSCY